MPEATPPVTTEPEPIVTDNPAGPVVVEVETPAILETVIIGLFTLAGVALIIVMQISSKGVDRSAEGMPQWAADMLPTLMSGGSFLAGRTKITSDDDGIAWLAAMLGLKPVQVDGRTMYEWNRADADGEPPEVDMLGPPTKRIDTGAVRQQYNNTIEAPSGPPDNDVIDGR